ncbi:NADP-dependent oxidoreductase [Planococcus halotolerans]|uniref:NADP-dependent oxidoreductase n=1 Tax=Planococcus halotolerans TaxID=2233542 RepID=A0A365KYM9_9BACL|nr:NADP-dependent oxidoreductase [Planococcus halotolerans]QHJ72127.1 zinc-binding dehydrogenase [Planococcus halotolerans]RAZ77857.1 NADP-dependent oxidoreductase [Planococcus halotolerans]
MTPKTYKEIHLANRPEGTPSNDDFAFIEKEIGSPGEGEVLLKTLYLSVDPYMRGRMRDVKSYVAPYKLNEAISGGILAEVVESNSELLQKGDIVNGTLKWAEYNIAKAEKAQKVDPTIAPITTRLGILGLTGLTAYFGLLDIGKPLAGETVVVSGAAGAVGSVVGQIAKLKGARAVGIAGSQEKIDYLINELGFDAAVNYKSDSFKEDLKQALPDGVDVYFDNVGGEVSDAVIWELNNKARVVLCGTISSYNTPGADIGPRIQWKFITTSSMMKGFTLGDYASEFRTGATDLGKWLQEGKLKYEETIVEGFENTPQAFFGLFEGSNLGKQLVKVADPEFAEL